MFFRLFLIALAFSVYAAESFRYVRQAENGTDTIQPVTLPFPSTDTPCPVRCILALTQAYTKAISLELPTPSMIEGSRIAGNNDTFSVMCSLFSTYSRCLRGCDVSNSERNKAARDATPPVDQICAAQQSDFDSSYPCLANNTKTYQRVCQNQNENALAAAVRLMSPRLEDTVLNDYCSSANAQLYCLFPLIRQTCGDTPYDLIRSIINASFVSIRVAIGEEEIAARYPSCETFLNTIGQGIPSVAVPLDNSTTTSTATAETTVESTTSQRSTIEPIAIDDDNSTLTTDSANESTTTFAVRRDDADGPIENGERLDGKPPSTTPSSHASVSRSTYSIFTFFTFSLVFHTFL